MARKCLAACLFFDESQQAAHVGIEVDEHLRFEFLYVKSVFA